MREFTLRAEHVKLLARAYVRWEDCESGAPAIDCKRPYGNSGVASDVAEILGREPERCPHCEETLGDSDEDGLLALHRETETALQVVLSAQSFEPGVYQETGYSGPWERKPNQ